MLSSKILRVFSFAALAYAACASLNAQLIKEKIDESRLRRLAGNTRPEASADNDRGRVSDDLALDHMLLQLKRSPDQEAAVQKAIDSLHDPASRNFHQWMSASEFGNAFGASRADIDTLTAWLESHGFTVDSVSASRMTIDFSGTAGSVREAFRTEIHNLDVAGVSHIANMTDPEIPEALAPAVAGIVSLHDFRPRAMKKERVQKARPDYTFTSGGSTYQAVSPADLATIYNLTLLFSAGVTGKGQTIAVIEDTDLYKASDWATFRSTFGLSGYAGSLVTVHPANCAGPGVNGDDGEAILDAEWASAAAPDAVIEVASCANTRTTFGGLIALQNLVNSPAAPPPIVSISYGECEAENGAGANAAFNSAYQTAVARGVSVFVSAGDEGAASCDGGAKGATHGIGVSGFASTPNNVAVGGTDFGDTVAGTDGTYWRSANSTTYESAISYIPEIPWNDSCAGALLSAYAGYHTPYGAGGFCGSATANKDGFLEVVAGSGGPSGCAMGAPASTGIVGGACAGYAKPSWQNAGDGVRDIPDVSLFAANGIWGHYYPYCFTDARNGGASCSGAPSTWAGAGGTSFSSPILAGIQALVNQKEGGPQGNPNYVYYKLASAGVFHNVTNGDIAVNCGGTQQCFGASASAPTPGRGHAGGGQSLNGVLSTSDNADDAAYGTMAGWNFATGLGSVDASKLVASWTSGK